MESNAPGISDEKIYWLQIFISIIFGVIAYYILELMFPYGVSDTVFLHIASLWIVSGIYFGILMGIPLFLLIFKYKEKPFQAFKRVLKNFGTQLCLFILIVGIIFLVNI